MYFENDNISFKSASTQSSAWRIQYLQELTKQDDELLRMEARMAALIENDTDDDVDNLPESVNSEAEVPTLLRRINEQSEWDEWDDDSSLDSNGSDGGEEDVTAQAFRELQVFTLNEVLLKGLRLLGYTERRINRAKKITNVERFKAHFSSIPKVVAAIWEDLQTVVDKEIWVPPSKRNFDHFLMALHHLKRYPTEFEREAIFDISPNYSREWVQYYVKRIRALKKIKIVWNEGYKKDDQWVLTVDGTHCWIHEPQHPTWSQDSEYYSHKFAKAGMNYELGISLTESRLIWMNGPFKAGTNDVTIFKDHGLKEKLNALGQMAIGDGGYGGHPNHISAPNAHDSLEVKRFKSRALKRHERFNGYTKTFDCLNGRFRHGTDSFADCFEAVCVICQYQMENGFDLYDILLEDMLYDL